MDLIDIYSKPQNENRINIGQLCNSIILTTISLNQNIYNHHYCIEIQSEPCSG